MMVFFLRKFCCPLILYFLLPFLPASFPFLSPFFFFCWAFTRLPFGGKRFSKKFENHEFCLKEVGAGSVTRFSLEFSGQSYIINDVFLHLSLVCLTDSRSFGYGLKDLISLHMLIIKVV